MKNVVIIVVFLFAAIGVFGFTASENTAPQQAKSFSSIQSEMKSGATLYDVRTAAEYKSGHFKDALNFSLQDMQAGRLPDGPKDRKIYIYCQSGNRSSQAAKLLADAGYTGVVDLGGLQDVQAIGGELE